MSSRVDYAKLAPGAMKAMLGLEAYVHASGLEQSLVYLLKLCASFINRCAYCIDMHSKDARANGETEQRVYALPAWRETPYYTPRERAALAWCEAVTRLGDEGVPDEVRAWVREEFTDLEMVNLTMAIVAINGWNRLAISLGADVGSYQPARRAERDHQETAAA
jgi:AhpD family alkylhydroperoxidase